MYGGVLGNAHLGDSRTPPGPALYLSTSRFPDAMRDVVVRVQGEPSAVVPSLRGALASLDAAVPLYEVETMTSSVDRSLALDRFTAQLLIGFAAAALALAGVGVFGVFAGDVSARRREIGIRLALGGTTGSVFRLVLRDGVIIIGIGVVVGIAGALAVGQSMRSVLFNVTPFEPGVLASVTLTLIAIAFVASAIPALRASRTNPTVVLGK